ncbi:hypothetical protein EBR96_07860 [bacterium]|nr:hypothetical protein [bacterium]
MQYTPGPWVAGVTVGGTLCIHADTSRAPAAACNGSQQIAQLFGPDARANLALIREAPALVSALMEMVNVQAMMAMSMRPSAASLTGAESARCVAAVEVAWQVLDRVGAHPWNVARP